MRAILLRHRTALINQMRGFLGERGFAVCRSPEEFKRAVPELLRASADELTLFCRMLLTELLVHLRAIEERIHFIEISIHSFMKRSTLWQRAGESDATLKCRTGGCVGRSKLRAAIAFVENCGGGIGVVDTLRGGFPDALSKQVQFPNQFVEPVPPCPPVVSVPTRVALDIACAGSASCRFQFAADLAVDPGHMIDKLLRSQAARLPDHGVGTNRSQPSLRHTFLCLFQIGGQFAQAFGLVCVHVISPGSNRSRHLWFPMIGRGSTQGPRRRDRRTAAPEFD
ncbi:hypothetical protein LMG27177_06296 [Paraburkholderia fynbosensis]|uniref:Uncharacterized protein n=1 Tax=Paraburkholderia fynbosensis TaxID=1200993 RepID=A0A6J5GW06_9BURK|nr:hypothetical protein [Paraburkholderia fynbosensis]CAB3807271.1 hypothetical protein LMG27177_06296 [Paraburkholderia fynbosensis]